MSEIYTYGQWIDIVDRGTSGDQVMDILASWKVDAYKLLEDNHKLEAELARRDEELALTEKKLCNIDRSARAEVARLNAEIKTTDDLLKEATCTIGAVIACCTYNSNDDAKIGIYGIDLKAFTMIDQFITHYNDAVSAGKVSVDVKTSWKGLEE